MKYLTYYNGPFGPLGLVEEDDALTHVLWREEKAPAGMLRQETPLLRHAAAQLAEYFAGRRREFDLPLRPAGTEFQQRVWQALRAIPYGQTRSYKEIAAQIGNPQAGRAVGMANNRNPIAIIIPCHRVIGSDGRLVGYAAGLELKRRLLGLEAR